MQETNTITDVELENEVSNKEPIHTDANFVNHPTVQIIVDELTKKEHKYPLKWISNATEVLTSNDPLEVVGIVNDYLRRALMSQTLKTGENTTALRMKLYEATGKEWLEFILSTIVPYMVEHDLPVQLTTQDLEMVSIRAKQEQEEQTNEEFVEVDTPPDPDDELSELFGLDTEALGVQESTVVEDSDTEPVK